MSDLEKLMQNLGGNYEQSNYDESFDLDEAFKRMPKAARQQVLTNAVKQSNGDVKHVGSQSGAAIAESLIAASVGDLNLTVTRSGVAVTAPLPFILFGLNDFTAGYISTLQSLMGAVTALVPGTTVAVSTSANGSVVFTYTDGMNVDTVTVSNLGNLNYKAFLASMNNNFFKTRFCELSISDETQNLLQFAQPILFGELSSLGLAKANQVVLRSRINSMTYRKDRVELIMPEQKITPDFSFASSIVEVNDFSIGFDFFMSWRGNLNKL